MAVLGGAQEWRGTLRVPPQLGCPRICPPWAHRSYATACRAIARPFARLAIACFYVYGLMYFDTDLELISIVQCSFTWPQQRVVEAIQLELLCNEPASNALNSTITQQQVCGAIRCMDTAVWKLHDTFLRAASVYVFPPHACLSINSAFDHLCGRTP